MTAMLIDNEAVAVNTRAARLRPVRSRVRSRATADPRHGARSVSTPWVAQPVSSCVVERSRPRVTLTESVVPTAGTWRLTERGIAVLVLAVFLAFGTGFAVIVAQFLAITAG